MSDAKKRELIKRLKKERVKGEKFDHHFAIIEQKKVTDSLGLLKVEWYQGDKLHGSASFMFPLEKTDDSEADQWSKLQIGENRFYGVTLDLKSKSLTELASGFFRRSFEEGKLQD